MKTETQHIATVEWIHDVIWRMVFGIIMLLITCSIGYMIFFTECNCASSSQSCNLFAYLGWFIFFIMFGFCLLLSIGFLSGIFWGYDNQPKVKVKVDE